MKKKRFNKGGSAAIFVKFIEFTAIAFASCKKGETGKAHTTTLKGIIATSSFQLSHDQFDS
jgi:hypothetical protein